MGGAQNVEDVKIALTCVAQTSMQSKLVWLLVIGALSTLEFVVQHSHAQQIVGWFEVGRSQSPCALRHHVVWKLLPLSRKAAACSGACAAIEQAQFYVAIIGDASK